MLWLNNQTHQLLRSEAKQFFFKNFERENFFSSQQLDDNAETIFRDILLCTKQEFDFVSSFYCKESLFANFLSLLTPLFEEEGKNRILLPTTAEENFINIFQYLQYHNFAYDWVVCNKEGVIEKNDFIEAITPKTLLFSLSLGDGLLGTIIPLEEILLIIKERKILLHIDFSHYIKYLKVNKSLIDQVDIITFSGSSLGGVSGSGGLFIRHSLLKYKNIFSNSFQNNPQNSLTSLNISLAKELSFYHHSLEQNNVEVTSLRNYFEKKLLQLVPDIEILFTNNSRLPNISTIIFKKVSAESLAFLLFSEGIICNLGFNQFQLLSQALQSCGYSPLEAYSTLSFAFDISHDLDTVNKLISSLEKNVKKLLKQNKIL